MNFNVDEIKKIFDTPLTLTERVEVEQIVHFYFCLIVAIKIDKKNTSYNNTYRIHFLNNWLLNCQKKKLFSKHLIEDIKWLRNEINKGKKFNEMESTIIHAYNMFLTLSNSHK